MNEDVLVWLTICMEPGANDLHIGLVQLLPLPPHPFVLR